jgi:hypothetical protein
MVTKAQFKQAASLAVQNIIKHGDTDIFPFPFENHAFFDRQTEIIDLVVEYDDNFEEYLTRFSPLNVSSLTPVTYSGFRWATQIDPIWNAHFLACVLSIAKKMEEARAPKSDNIVFSYRSQANPETGDLFDRDFGWYAFSLFVERRRGSTNIADLASEAQAERAWLDTMRRLAPYSEQGLDVHTSLDQEETAEVAEIAARLGRVFDFSQSTILRPKFPGCGYVDASEGDVIFGPTLFEVKTVDRPVSSSDIRQTLTYAALNAAAPDPFDIQKIGLFNPRRGQFCDIEIDYICSEIAGLPAQELFEVIVQALSSGEISR